MRINLLAMSDNCAERGFISSCHQLRTALSRFGDCQLQYCGSIHALFSSMVGVLDSSPMVVVAVSPRQYIRCKKKIIAALGLPSVCDENLQKKIAAHAGMERDLAEEHALIASGSVLFPTEDGLYSGFAVESSAQRILFLSTDSERLPHLLEEQVLPYFSNVLGLPLPESDVGKEEKQPEEQVPPTLEQPVPEPPDAVVKNIPEMREPSDSPSKSPDSAEQVFFRALSKAQDSLQAKGHTVAFARTKSTRLLHQLLGREEADGNAMIFGDCTFKRGGENPRDYTARLAKSAMEAAGSDYGAAVSNVFSSETEISLYIALTDGKNAYVCRFFLPKEERPDQLLAIGFMHLFQSMVRLSDGDVTVQELAGDASVSSVQEKADRYSYRLSKKTKIVLGACVAALILVCTVMGLFLRTPTAAAVNSVDEADTEFYKMVGWTELTTAESTLPETTLLPETIEEATTEETTKAIVLAKPQNKQEDAGGVGFEEPAPPPVIHGGSDSAGAEEKPVDFAGSFTVTTYGYGHGVGMSQYGANEFAKEGWDYARILTHYYTDTKLVKDPVAGTAGIPSADDIARVVQQEMGSTFELEALKAQAVAAYTFARCHGNSIDGMSSVSDITKVSEKVRDAVNAVYGWIVTNNGSPINAVFHAMSAGKTAASQTIWGGAVSYLTPVQSQGDIRQSRYQVSKTYSAREMADILNDALGVEMAGDPATWFKILSHDRAVSDEIGYVRQMRIQINPNSYTDISGNYFRENVMGYSRMRSPCYSITYQA